MTVTDAKPSQGGKAIMKKKISPLPFKGTPEQEAQLLQIIAENKQDPSMLMGVMQKAQIRQLSMLSTSYINKTRGADILLLV